MLDVVAKRTPTFTPFALGAVTMTVFVLAAFAVVAVLRRPPPPSETVVPTASASARVPDEAPPSDDAAVSFVDDDAGAAPRAVPTARCSCADVRTSYYVRHCPTKMVPHCSCIASYPYVVHEGPCAASPGVVCMKDAAVLLPGHHTGEACFRNEPAGGHADGTLQCDVCYGDDRKVTMRADAHGAPCRGFDAAGTLQGGTWVCDGRPLPRR